MNRTRVLDLDALRAFVSVAGLGSFTQTAKRLNLTQSAITMRIRRLEDAEGVRLVTRRGRLLELTPAGRALLPYAQRLLALNEEARAALHGVQVVRLAAMEDYATRVLPPVLADFARAAPEIAVQVEVGITPRMLADLDGRHDLVLAMHRLGESSKGAPLHPTQPIWAAAPGFELPPRGTIPLALYADGCAFRAWALEALSAAGRPWRLAFSSPSQTAVEAAAASGVALTVARASTIAPSLCAVRGLPALPAGEIRLHRARATSEPARRLGAVATARPPIAMRLEMAARTPIFSKRRTKVSKVPSMASGWAPDGAVQDQIDDTVADGVLRARARMSVGAGETHCVECGDEIPEARRRAVPGVLTCVGCQAARDRRPAPFGINRRGSKDSQLK